MDPLQKERPPMPFWNQHLNDADLIACLDGEPAAHGSSNALQHIAGCQRCQEALLRLQERRQRLQASLAQLEPEDPDRFTSWQNARLLYGRRINQSLEMEKETTSMSKLFTPRYRPAWIVLAVVLVLAAAMSFAPVRALANNFLGLFRVQQISVIEVDPSDLPAQLGESTEFQALLSENVTFEDGGEPFSVASAAEAAPTLGFSPRLPDQAESTPTLTVAPGGSASFLIDLPRVQALLQAIERSDIELPAELDGATAVLNVPASLAAGWGDCKVDLEAMKEPGYDPDMRGAAYPLSNCTTLVQMLSPTISAPEGLDLQQLGQAYLQVLGMEPEEAAQFASTVDWTTTLVLPLPRYQAQYSQVLVDGVEGVLVQQGEGSPQGYMLAWVKDGVLYALTGPGEVEEALALGNSLK
jgi:hypothetical protein